MLATYKRISAWLVSAAAVAAFAVLLSALQCTQTGSAPDDRVSNDAAADDGRQDKPIKATKDAAADGGCLDCPIGATDAAADAGEPSLEDPDCSQCSSSGWCRIEPGTFTMGAPEDEPTRGAFSEDPVTVTLTRPFEIMQHEVTVAEWKAMDLPLSSFQKDCTDDRCPVFATWFDAMHYANLLSEHHDPPLDPCYELVGCSEADGDKGTVCEGASETGPLYDCPGYRLPTEAEWEYACRAGTTTAFYSGPVTESAVDQPRFLLSCYEEPNLNPIAWYCKTSDGAAHPVGGKHPNPWCLFDMPGNVFEWTNGGYDGHSYGSSPQTDPGSRLGALTRRVRRGGPYFGAPADATCFARRGAIPDIPKEGEGLRLVRTLAKD